MHTPIVTGESRWSGVEPRLLELDPDLAELFAEVEETLRVARLRWAPRLGTVRAPRPRKAISRRPAPRGHGRRPSPGRAYERGPPGVAETPRRPNSHGSEVMPVPIIPAQGLRRATGRAEPIGLQWHTATSPHAADRCPPLDVAPQADPVSVPGRSLGH